MRWQPWKTTCEGSEQAARKRPRYFQSKRNGFASTVQDATSQRERHRARRHPRGKRAACGGTENGFRKPLALPWGLLTLDRVEPCACNAAGGPGLNPSPGTAGPGLGQRRIRLVHSKNPQSLSGDWGFLHESGCGGSIWHQETNSGQLDPQPPKYFMPPIEAAFSCTSFRQRRRDAQVNTHKSLIYGRVGKR